MERRPKDQPILTGRRTLRIADEQPSDGWDDTPVWVGTFGVFVTTLVLGRILILFGGIPPVWDQIGRFFAVLALIAFIASATWTARWGRYTRYDARAKAGLSDRHLRDRVQTILATRRSP